MVINKAVDPWRRQDYYTPSYTKVKGKTVKEKVKSFSTS